VAGVLAGLLFGEYCAPLAWVGDAFIGLLRMTVLPFIVVSTIASVGKLRRKQSLRLALAGGATLLLLWVIGLFTVTVLAVSLPEWTSGWFYSVVPAQPAQETDLLEIFIPSNFFKALTKDYVPGVILLCVLLGTALAQLREQRALLTQLDVLARALTRVAGMIAKLSPIGVFALSASAAGTLALDEVSRLQAYLVSYVLGTALLGALVLPLLITAVTPFRYRDIAMVTKAAVVTVFATGKLIIVLPLLAEESKRLFERLEDDKREEGGASVELLYPIGYAFPHLGKVLALLFIPFAAWFLGQPLGLGEYPQFLTVGLFSTFGGPLIATPFLLDTMHLPHDMFQLFLLTGVVSERFGDALGVMHLVAFTLITASFVSGIGRLDVRRLGRMVLVTSVVGIASIAGLRAVFAHTLDLAETEDEFIANMQELTDLVEVTLVAEPGPNPEPLQEGETLLERIQRRGVLRVGYSDDSLPFAFVSSKGQLVGFDVWMAEGLALDLGVSLELVRFDRQTLVQQLEEDHFDVVMSGLVGTLERATAMEHTSPYLHVTSALVVPDHRVRSFSSAGSIQSLGGLRVGFVDLSRGYVERFERLFPDVELVRLASNREYFEGSRREPLDALLTSAEVGTAHTLLYPDYEAVVPRGLDVTLPLFYGVGARDGAMREFLEHWVRLRKGDGTFDEQYERWVLGRRQQPAGRRWSVLKDVLGWIP